MENEVEQLQRDILETQASLKLIQEQIANKKPWYREISGLISMAAFLLSIGTTFYSCQRESAQDRSAAQMTMNSLSQRLISLPKESLEARIKYKDDPQSLGQVLSLANMETATNIDTLAVLIQRYPSVATDHHQYVLALSLKNNGMPIRGNKILSLLARNAKNLNVLVAANRELAAVDFFNNQSDKGRERYRESIAIVNQSPELDILAKNLYNQYTYLSWAISEYQAGDCSAAKEVLERAKALAIPGDPHGKSISLADQTIQICLLGKQPHPFQLPPLPLPQNSNVLPSIPR